MLATRAHMHPVRKKRSLRLTIAKRDCFRFDAAQRLKASRADYTIEGEGETLTL
ncbi:hypothetical protein CGRA01v4_05414 [Colletotrichum graminicola]|nr:hypothetical protein CGRA01v4_05414 [Colletotrichum graminicola]